MAHSGGEKRILQAILRNGQHPEYVKAAIPFPIPDEEYAPCIELLYALEIGNLTKRDCIVQKLQSDFPVLERLEMVNIILEALDYLVKRLDSFCDQKSAQFQEASVKFKIYDICFLVPFTNT